jgi:hypothetical protein
MELPITAVFDGRAFVPSQPVALPPGTRVRLLVGADEPVMTAGESDRVLALAGDGTAPPWPTVEEAMAHTRRRPPTNDSVGSP